MIEVAVTELGRHELTFAAGVLGRGFRDNPITVAVVGGDPLRRMRGAERALGSAIALMEHPPLAARRGDWIVGVCGMAPPGTCHPRSCGSSEWCLPCSAAGPSSCPGIFACYRRGRSRTLLIATGIWARWPSSPGCRG